MSEQKVAGGTAVVLQCRTMDQSSRGPTQTSTTVPLLSTEQFSCRNKPEEEDLSASGKWQTSSATFILHHRGIISDKIERKLTARLHVEESFIVIRESLMITIKFDFIKISFNHLSVENGSWFRKRAHFRTNYSVWASAALHRTNCFQVKRERRRKRRTDLQIGLFFHFFSHCSLWAVEKRQCCSRCTIVLFCCSSTAQHAEPAVLIQHFQPSFILDFITNRPVKGAVPERVRITPGFLPH